MDTIHSHKKIWIGESYEIPKAEELEQLSHKASDAGLTKQSVLYSLFKTNYALKARKTITFNSDS